MNSNKIKISLAILIAGFFTFSAEPLTGQPASTNAPKEEFNEAEPDNYATLVRKIPHIKASIKTARQMKANDRHRAGKFEVIICGKVVKKLGNRPQVNNIVEKGQALSIRFSACGMSMNKFGIEKSDLAEGIQVIPNGIVRMFDLQEQGYYAVEL